MSSEKPRILCSIPTYHAVDPHPFLKFLEVAQEAGRAEAAGKYAVRWQVGGPKIKTQNVRNQACKTVLEGGATHLAFVDDDMLLEPKEIFERLLAHDKDIVSPLFFRTEGDYEPLVFQVNGDGIPRPTLDYPKNSLFEVNCGVGTGVMLIKKEVLEALGDPWFFYPSSAALGMDIHFCQRAIQKGFKVWCDTSIVVRQMAIPKPVGEEEFLRRMDVGLTGIQ